MIHKVSESLIKSFDKHHGHALETFFESRFSYFFLGKFRILVKFNHHFYHSYFSTQLKDNLAYQKHSEILTVREVSVEIKDLDKGKLDTEDKV